VSSSTAPALRQLAAALRVFLVLSVLLGIAYPLAMTALAQLVFPRQADGSLVESGGKVVGSELIGQAFTVQSTENGGPATDADGLPVMAPDPAYFQMRPSAAGTGYDPLATSASNLGPENEDLVALIEERRTAAAELDGVEPAAVPADALLASGSGLDPHISPAYAAQQVARVARERGLEVAEVRRLVADHTDGRALGFLGEPAVNVLMLNLALDARATAQGGD
jgi:K+-transporting ATPase ATPase C chain